MGRGVEVAADPVVKMIRFLTPAPSTQGLYGRQSRPRSFLGLPRDSSLATKLAAEDPAPRPLSARSQRSAAAAVAKALVAEDDRHLRLSSTHGRSSKQGVGGEKIEISLDAHHKLQSRQTVVVMLLMV